MRHQVKVGCTGSGRKCHRVPGHRLHQVPGETDRVPAHAVTGHDRELDDAIGCIRRQHGRCQDPDGIPPRDRGGSCWARRNVELLVERLMEQGYLFHSNDDSQTPATPYCRPSSRSQELADWLQGRFDAVPMTLLSWVRLVGDLWLVGTHPQWPESSSADPLVIEVEGSRYPGESIREYFEGESDAWREWNTEHSGAPVRSAACPGPAPQGERQWRCALRDRSS